MQIRVGRPEDMKAVLELIQELAVFEKEPDAVMITVDDLIKDGFGTVPLFHTYIALVNDVIVGVALYYFRYSTWKGKTIHLEDLIVTEKHRSHGVGSALYQKIMEEAQNEGVKRVEWAVLDWNTPAIAFYNKTGAQVFDDWRVVQMNEQGLQAFLSR